MRVHYTVENTGNIALASNISVGATTWFGIPTGGEQGDGIPELLPGGTRTYETDLPGIASWGYLNAHVRLNPFVEGDDETKRMSVAPTSRDTILIAPPWSILIAIALVALFFVSAAGDARSMPSAPQLDRVHRGRGESQGRGRARVVVGAGAGSDR